MLPGNVRRQFTGILRIIGRRSFLKAVSPPRTGVHNLIRQSPPSRAYSPLSDPTVIFSDNHLLVVNKPPGWHSVPNPEFSKKCILTKLQKMRLGGGSKQDFLLPLHRIDQPCSGLLMLGKTSKAGTRITKLWKKKLVEKQYLAVVKSRRLPGLQHRSLPLAANWFCLRGVMESRKSKDQRSVVIRPNQKASHDGGRSISIEWKVVVQGSTIDNPYVAVLVRTSEGARHMVRALLAQVGKCPIEGDLRYDSTASTLSDQSVALHGYRITLDNKLQLGSLETHKFDAPIPSTWDHFFGIVSQDIVDDQILDR